MPKITAMKYSFSPDGNNGNLVNCILPSALLTTRFLQSTQAIKNGSTKIYPPVSLLMQARIIKDFPVGLAC